MNLSTKPRVGFTEVNVIMQGLNDIDTLAEFVQIGVDYIMNHFSVNCSSYNLFFYLIEGNIHVKIMPRFATSPLFIGYNIELVPNNLQGIAKHIKQLYFDKKTTKHLSVVVFYLLNYFISSSASCFSGGTGNISKSGLLS